MNFAKFRPTRQTLLKFCAFAVVGTLALTQLSQANAKTVIIDVRTPQEYQMGHPLGAINIPYNDIANQIFSKGVDKADTIKVYSRGGNRAEQAKTTLKSAGFSNVVVDQQK